MNKAELLKVKEEIKSKFPYLEKRPFIIWEQNNDLMLSEHTTDPDELFGHEFIVNLKDETLTPKIIN